MSANMENLLILVKQLIAEKQYEGVLVLFRPDQVDNLNVIKCAVSEFLEVILPHLNDDNYKNDAELYGCCEELMKILATNAGAEEMLLELLQIVEESGSENLFTTALKCLQICLLRLNSKKSRALEWTLNSIVNRITELKIPEYLVSGYNQRQEKLLEQNDDILKVLTNYITLAFFYEPLLEEAEKDKDEDRRNLNRRNVLCCFFLQLLGKPLCYLDLTMNERKTNTYTMQCATSLAKAACRLLGNPFYLLSLVEDKAADKSKTVDVSEDNFDINNVENIFKMEEKLPMESMGIFFYLLIVEGIASEYVPKVYNPLYIFESCLYLVTDFLVRQAPALQWRGLLLCHRTIDDLDSTYISNKSVSNTTHEGFRRALCQIIGYSEFKRLRQSGIVLLKKYILRFEDESRCKILRSLVTDVSHAGLKGYLCTIYKDLVAEKLAAHEQLPPCFSGSEFADFLLKHTCVLNNGVETDLIEDSDQIIPALNVIRYFALTDESNVTGFWNINKKIESDFLDPLRLAINMSVAHYQLEKKTMKDNNGMDPDYERTVELLNVIAFNDSSNAGLSLEPSKKLEVLDRSLTTFDLLKCLLARATECVEKRHRNICNANKNK